MDLASGHGSVICFLLRLRKTITVSKLSTPKDTHTQTHTHTKGSGEEKICFLPTLLSIFHR